MIGDILSKYASLILCICLLGFCSPLYAQTPKSKTEGFMGEEYRKNLYEQRKRSQIKAIGYSLLLPGMGNFYVDQYFSGTLALSAMVFASIFASYAYTTDQPEFYYGAAIFAGAAYIGAPISASLGAEEFNSNLRRALKVSLTPLYREEKWGLALKLSF